MEVLLCMLLRTGCAPEEHHGVCVVGRAEGQETPTEACIHAFQPGLLPWRIGCGNVV